jgi:hypothetical protein
VSRKENQELSNLRIKFYRSNVKFYIATATSVNKAYITKPPQRIELYNEM